MSFAFYPDMEPGKRVDLQLIQVGDEYIHADKLYKICIKSYMYNGCDGFSMFKNAKVLVC